jgi:hypothetical protein
MQVSRVTFFVCFLLAATPCLAQETKTEIIYTGKLMGYFRSPAKQSWQQAPGCKALSTESSTAAIEFQNLRNEKRNAVLVGTGDNFAPELEARMFMSAKPRDEKEEKKLHDDLKIPSDDYIPGNKELYYWDRTGDPSGSWVYYKAVKKGSPLERQLALGEGTIPTDNVGCFLAANRFAAMVPGKHDFYFGAERVRELGRFMAGLTVQSFSDEWRKAYQEYKKLEDYQPPQMLGANLVIKTSVAGSAPGGEKSKIGWEGSSVKIADGKSVYPWFASTVDVKIPVPPEIKDALSAQFPSQTKATLTEVIDYLKTLPPPKDEVREKFIRLLESHEQINICPTKDLNVLPVQCDGGWTVNGHAISLKGESLNYPISIPANPTYPWSKARKGPVFEPGSNYGLCQMMKEKPKDPKEHYIATKCETFSVKRPFLSLPRDGSPYTYNDPDPFVLIPGDHQQPEVAIFGVVDPTLTQYIGVLNYSWMSEDNNGAKSVLSVEDPLEALREQLDYFDAWYQATNPGKKFTGMKVLLAQMSPHIARKLAARLNQFQLVVTEADEELGTSETTLTTEWNAKVNSSAFIAVPAPYYQSGLKDGDEGNVHFGAVTAKYQSGVWRMVSSFKGATLVKNTYMSDEKLAKLLEPAVKKCFGPAFVEEPNHPTKIEETIRIATLCAMRERLSADVALIQKRDLFSRVPDKLQDVQQVLDYLIWKGDLLTLLYVPGSALKSALEASKKYDLEDANNLSLADEKDRGLAFLGIVSRGKDSLINEAPLDEKKIYTLATTDYVAGGDTGYLDLTKALDAKTQPSQYPAQLEPISGLVCARINSGNSKAGCLAPTNRDEYLDQIAFVPGPAPTKGEGFGSKLWKLFPFKLGDKDQKQTTLSGFRNQQTEQRGFWVLSLKNFGVSFSGLRNNLSDTDIAAKFAGVKTSGVTAKQAQTISSSLDLRLFHTSHTGGPFIQTNVDYKRQSTGDLAPRISQITNLVTGEAGYLRNLRGGRSDKSMGMSFSLYTETQLQKPFSTFTLGTDSLKVAQDRSLMLLPRAGLFWRNGTNAFTAGIQYGRELKSLVGYRFISPAGTFECLPQVNQTFADCIKKLSSGNNPKVTINSDAFPIVGNRPRAGFYWTSAFTLPLNSKMKYEFSDKGSFFFNFSNDNATDTRYRSDSKHSLKFMIWPSLSIGPSLRLLLYRNKVNKDFLFQKEFGFETSFAFDLFNRREKEVQIKHKP